MAFSASSRLFDLNGEANSASKKHNSATIVYNVRRFCHQIIRTTFSVHTPVSPQLVIVGGILQQNPAQVRFAQDNHMVHALAPDRSDQPFSEAILPRRRWCSRLVPDAHGTQSACDDVAVDAIPITDQVLRSFIPGKCLCYLTRDPFCRRIWCDVDPDEVSTVQPNDNEGIEQIEANGRNNEQVHGGDIWGVITQEGAPSLGLAVHNA
jgi:xanthine/CO dehydrogenase XdhC/CoxF family maturation factor